MNIDLVRSSSPSRLGDNSHTFDGRKRTSSITSVGSAVSLAGSDGTRSQRIASKGILRGLVRGDVSEESHSDISSDEVRTAVSRETEHLAKVEKDRERDYKALRESISSTATEIGRFKEKNDALFAKVLEMNAFIQHEYDTLMQSIASGEFDVDLAETDSGKRLSLRAPIRPLSSAQRFQIKVDDKKPGSVL